MENAEETLQIIERFTKLKQKNIPKELDEYLSFVARTGDTVYRWPTLKYLFREKLANVISEFYDFNPSIDGLLQYPNVDPFNYEGMKKMILDRFEAFTAAPFTVQRICELLTEPRRQYTRVDKFMRAVEKNILVVSTQEPGRKRNDSETNESFDSIIYGGDLSSEVNVDIEMDGDFCLPTAELVVTDEIASTSHVNKTKEDGEEKKEENSKKSPSETATSVVQKLQSDDDADKALAKIEAEIDKSMNKAKEDHPEEKIKKSATPTNIQHTETELLQSIIETAKSADIDVTESPETDDTFESKEISHVKKLQDEVAKLDSIVPVTHVAELSDDEDLDYDIEEPVMASNNVIVNSPKREHGPDVAENDEKSEEQSPKKAKIETEKTTGIDAAESAVSEDYKSKEEEESITLDVPTIEPETLKNAVKEPRVAETKPIEVIKTSSTSIPSSANIVEGITDSSSSSSTNSTGSDSISRESVTTADDGASKTEINSISANNTETSEIIDTNTVNNNVVESISCATVEVTDTDLTNSEAQQVQLVLPSVQTVVEQEPILETAPEITSPEPTPETTDVATTAELNDQATEPTNVVTPATPVESEETILEPLVTEPVELPTAEDSVEMDVIPPTRDVTVSPSIANIPTAAIAGTVDPINVMATDDEQTTLAIEIPTITTSVLGKSDETAMDVDESSSGAITGEPMEDQ